MPKIRLENISKKFNNTLIIDNLSLDIADNEFTVFIGASGCGKSTLLRLIAGLDDVTSGNIYFDTHNVTQFPPAKRNLAMVFQDYALYPHLNVYDNMAFALKIAKIPKSEIKIKINNIASIIGLDSLLKRKPSELSGGQRQRVAMGRALVRDTDLLLMDEPLSNLDAQLRTSMRTELTLLKQKIQKNIIYVTHDQIEAMTLADKIVILNKGIVQQYDTPKALYKTPANKFVAEFLGSPKINILKAELKIIHDILCVYGNGFSIPLNPEIAYKFKNYPHKHLYIGIRPHDLHFTYEKNQHHYFKCRKIFQEYIGSQMIIHADCHGQTIQFEISASDGLKPIPAEFYLECVPNYLHFFDYKTEIRIV